MRSLKGAFMTQLLIRLFIRRPNSPQDPRVRAAYGNLASVVGMVCNILLCLGKFVVGTLFGSIAITADALNNLSDASSNIVSLVGFKLAAKAPDAEHPYGHARFEYLAGLVVSVTILGIGFSLLKESVTKVLHPTPVQFGWLTVAVLVVSILVKLWMSGFNRTIGRIISSETLIATAADSRNDVLTTGAVLAAALVEKLTGLHVDGWMGLAVGLFILCSGAGLAKETISPLLGEAASPELQRLIEDKIKENPYVLGYHDLMVHDYGPNQRFASIHVEMDHRESPVVCHEIIDRLERECLESHGIHLVIHYDPVVTDDPELNRLQDRVRAILKDIDPRLHIHDFRMVQGERDCTLIFDMTVPAALEHQKDRLRQAVADGLAETEEKTCHLVITYDPEAFNGFEKSGKN